eukprot:PhF_6_TR6295/c0_g1_i1/m.9534/K03327/TC.MATE, SLC47A, norM, mdtK, dinF; multidrug resistance protein, MATE family
MSREDDDTNIPDTEELSDTAEQRARWTEWKTLMKISQPVTIALLVSFGQGLTDLAFVGHKIGIDALTASSLALLWMNVSSVFIPRGLNAALSALCAQAIGAKNMSLAGAWVVNGLLIQYVALIPVCFAWWFTADVLQAVGIRDVIANLASKFARYSILYLYPTITHQSLVVWASAQHIVYPQAVVNFIGFAANFGFNFLFLATWGYIGSPIATTATKILQCIVFISWMVAGGYYKSSWPQEGLRKCVTLSRMKEYWKLAGPMVISGILEEWQLEGLTFMTSHISEHAVATHTSLMNLYMVFASACFGTSNATTIRCGYHLGGKRIRSARRTVRISFLYMLLPFGVLVGGLFYLLRWQLGGVFSDSESVHRLTAEIAPILGLGFVALSPFYVTMAALEAQGRPHVVATSYLVGCWFVCFPLAYVFAFTLDMGLLGIWIALCVGYFVTTSMSSIAVWNSDWEKARDEAVKRSEKE